MSITSPLGPTPRAGHEFATLGGGCFWCLEAVFEQVQGVIDVESGYAGGSVQQPTYRAVCAGNTGHAEVVRLEFDPAQISYRDILEIFFAMHDPTSLNRQGNDVGTQYRSVIYTHSETQHQVAERVISEVQCQRAPGDRPVVTQLEPVGSYYRAEDEHQEYFRHYPATGYCAVVIAPKIEKFRLTFAAKRKRDTGKRGTTY